MADFSPTRPCSGVPARVTIAVMKHYDQKQLRELRVYFIHGSSPKAAEARTEAEQEPGSRSGSRGHGREMLTGLVLTGFSELRLTSPEIAPPAIGCALPHQALIKEMPRRLANGQI